jgi:uncharacterized protein (TIGR02284 family)
MDRDNVISVINGLIETCRDGQNGFQEAAENVSRADLKQFFNEASLERARYVGELQGLVRSLGGDPENTGSTAAAIHRTWIDIKGSLTGRDDASILSECERGEDSAVSTYKDALDETGLSSEIRSIVERQYQQIHQVHDQVKQLRNAASRVS